MSSNAREGDFDSILEDDTLEDETQNLEDVLSEANSLIEDVDIDDDDEDDDHSDQSRIKLLIARGKDQGYLTYDQVTEVLPSHIVESDQFEGII
ncbi:MAG: hypothetical protein KDI36_09885, partial [Pseudomonadales bacterium]|nr:hypothetical protein [Pseudomonadales bacterium]